MPFVCASCFGSGAQRCNRCFGIAKAVCQYCFGPGKTIDGRCFECRSQGTVSCGKCESGSLECRDCLGASLKSTACPHCSGKKRHPCNGCGHGGYLAWEAAAELLADAGRFEESVRWLEAARSRCIRRYENAKRLDRYQDERYTAEWNDFMKSAFRRWDLRARLIKAVEADKLSELERLDGLIEEAREKLSKD